MHYETVCGLEVHTELATKTKIFCHCTTDFGGEVNSHCCEVCTGMPGTLPVLNERVVEFAVRCGLALHCEITRVTRFDRKNYFYPDLPKAYQISQLYLPICQNGWVEIDGDGGAKKKIRIREIHMEEDAGKLIHRNGKSLINYNRAGVPLLEIVSEPDIHSGAEAAAYTRKLREILRAIGVSDCKMQEGSLRADVNVSVREAGEAALGTRTEMKNLSSFKAIQAAVDDETRRQAAMLDGGEIIKMETRRWDEDKNASYLMRVKETAEDYKYFPEPDIPPLCISEEYIDNIRRTMPELPEAKRARYLAMGLSDYAADMMMSKAEYSALFEETVRLTALPTEAANYIMGDYRALQREGDGALTVDALAEVIRMVKQGKITRETGRLLLSKAYFAGVSPVAYAAAHGLEITADDTLTAAVCDKAIADHEKAVNEYRAGKEKAFNFLFGQCMRELKGRASPDDIKRILKEKLGV